MRYSVIASVVMASLAWLGVSQAASAAPLLAPPRTATPARPARPGSPAKPTPAPGPAPAPAPGSSTPAGLAPTFTLRGHEGEIGSGAFSPDGKILATGGDDQTFRLWDTATGQQIAMLPANGQEPAKPVVAQNGGETGRITFSRDGAMLVTWGTAPRVVVWDVASRKTKLIIDANKFDLGRALPCLAPDNSTLALHASEANKPVIKFFDLNTGNVRLSVNPKFQNQVGALAYSHDGKILVCGERQSTNLPADIVALDTATGNELWRAQTPGGRGVDCLAFAPDDKTLALGNWGDVNVWDVATRADKTNMAPGNRMSGGGGRCGWLTYLSGGKAVASGYGGAILRNPGTAAILRRFVFEPGAEAESLAISADGMMFAASAGRTIKLWKLPAGGTGNVTLSLPGGAMPAGLASGRENGQLVLRGHENTIKSVVFSSDSQQLYSVSEDKTLRAWNVADATQRYSVPCAAFGMRRLFLVGGGKRLLYGYHLFDIETGKHEGMPQVGGANSNRMVAATAANIAAAPSSENGVAIWDIPKPRPAVGARPKEEPRWVTLSPDAQTAYYYCYNPGTITIVDTTSGAVKGTFPAKDAEDLAVSPDTRLLALVLTKGATQELHLLEADTQKEIATAKIGGQPAFAPDGKMLLVGAKLLEVPSLKEMGHLEMGGGVFSPDGKLLALPDRDEIRILTVSDVIAGK